MLAKVENAEFGRGGVGDGYVIEPDEILDGAKGENHLNGKVIKVTVVCEHEDGVITVHGSHGAPESLMLLAWAQWFLVENRVVR